MNEKMQSSIYRINKKEYFYKYISFLIYRNSIIYKIKFPQIQEVAIC